ncbi:MAG: putative F420-dependent oxidoreductase [Limisphaerales bacterium]|jgi:probable F420-dependent oxidoreductase
MKYGFVVPNNFGIEDPHQLIHLGKRAEELGFDSLWVNHHVLNVGYVQERLGNRPYHDALVTLTWLAAETRRVKLGTSVLVMPYLHPMVLAKELATLDCLSRGRLVVGLGAGSLPDENVALGVPYESRGRYCNEFLQVMRLLWTTEEASFAGEFFSFENILTSPKPLQTPHPRMVIGGNRSAALKRVAQFGDGWHPMNCSPDGIRKRLASMKDMLTADREYVLDTVQVRLDMTRITPESVADYEDAGVSDLVLSLNTGDVEAIESALETFAENYFV